MASQQPQRLYPPGHRLLARRLLTGSSPYVVPAHGIFQYVGPLHVIQIKLHERHGHADERAAHDDGRTQVLLCIQGTIPVTFKTRTYNIPVAFWIPFDYPRQPPIVYVVPTATMLVRASAAVDVSGRCTGSYWKAWERKSEGCSLVDLAVDYQTMFGKEPPVYAKPAPSANAGPSAGSASPQKSTTPSQSTSYPQRPSQPGDSLQNGQAPSNASEKSSVIPGQGYRPAPKPPQDDITEPVSRSSQPQMPQRPASVSQSLQSPLSNMPRINGNTQPHRPPLPPTPVSGGAPPRPTSSILPQPRSILYSPAVPNSPSHASSMLFMQPPTLPQQPYMYSAPQAASPHPQAQLPPPRRPTNPDIVNLRTAVLNKLTDGLNAQSQVYHNDLAQLELLRQDLLKGEPAIRDEMGRLEAVKNVCMNVRDRYSVLVSDLASHVQNLEERDLGSEDEILACQSVLHSQSVLLSLLNSLINALR